MDKDKQPPPEPTDQGILESLSSKATHDLAQIRNNLDAISTQLSNLKPENKEKDFWDKLQVVSGLITACVVFILGYFFVQNVQNQLKQDEIDLKMITNFSSLYKEIISELGVVKDTEQTKNFYNAKNKLVTLLAFYGEYSIDPLINLMEFDSEFSKGVKEAIFGLSLSHKDKVCQKLINILSEDKKYFSSKTNLSAISIIKKIDCKNYSDVFCKYHKIIKQYEIIKGEKIYIKNFRNPDVDRGIIEEELEKHITLENGNCSKST